LSRVYGHLGLDVQGEAKKNSGLSARYVWGQGLDLSRVLRPGWHKAKGIVR
jgi:hypothetical protein